MSASSSSSLWPRAAGGRSVAAVPSGGKCAGTVFGSACPCYHGHGDHFGSPGPSPSCQGQAAFNDWAPSGMTQKQAYQQVIQSACAADPYFEEAQSNSSAESRLRFWVPHDTSSSEGSSSINSSYDVAPGLFPFQSSAHPYMSVSNVTSGTMGFASHGKSASSSDLRDVRTQSGSAEDERNMRAHQPTSGGPEQMIPRIVQALHQETGASIEELLQAHNNFDLSLVPRQQVSGELLSVGTIAHAAGDCKPCLFWNRSSCNRGVLCTYCHTMHPHHKFKRIKPSKRQRAERKAWLAAQQLDDDSGTEAENQQETVECGSVEAYEMITTDRWGITRMRL